MTHPATIVLIDDDEINNLVCQLVIQQTAPAARLQTFTSPHQGLEYLEKHCARPISQTDPAVLLLDINMPQMSGWQILDALSKNESAVRQGVRIYILSSSVNQKDKDHAGAYPLVAGFISKPLTEDKRRQVFTVSE